MLKIAIVGAGIAGCSIASALQDLNVELYILEKESQFAMGTSSHHMALSHPQVNFKKTKLQQFTQLANHLANKNWGEFQTTRGAFCPLTEAAWENIQITQERIDRLGLGASEAIAISQQDAFEKSNVNQPGIWFEEGALYDIPKICFDALMEIPKTHQKFHLKVSKLERRGNQWKLLDENGAVILVADCVVLANNKDAVELLESIGIALQLRPVRGQITRFQIPLNSELAMCLPKSILRGEGYCGPAIKTPEGYLWDVGSTYDEDQENLNAMVESDKENIERAANLLVCERSLLQMANPIEAFVGVRSASKDRMPLIGPVPGQSGIYLATAYGSRGIIWATLGSLLIKAYVEAFLAGVERLRAGFLLAGCATEVMDSVESSVVESVAPARFLGGFLAGARASNSKPIFPVS